jgi:hypothetical protein
MREQFKQISLMAGGSHYPDINSDNQDAFGRLIVEQCIKICQTVANTVDSERPNKNLDLAALICAEEIAHYFGVKL